MTPLTRRRMIAVASLALAFGSGPVSAGSEGSATFADFIEGLRPDAAARGISTRTFDAVFAEIRTPDDAVLARIAKQSEFSRPVWAYLADATAPARIERGRSLAERLSRTLDRIEATTGVPRWTILAFWGIESDFGTSPGTVPTVRALASLAFAGHKAADFRSEALAALQIIERGDISPSAMRGSWAGAMGQVQFLPSVFLKYAADYDGDGRADIWKSEEDSLYSVANYLQRIGWNAAVSWGYEVVLPKDYDLSQYRADLPDFARRGVRRVDGGTLPGSGTASLFLPGGVGGPIFLITENFSIIRIYNTSDAYALAVGHLADRLAGGPTIRRPWPGVGSLLDREGLTVLQRELTRRGLYAGEADGRAGPKLREAVRQYQIAAGLPADGFAGVKLLEQLRQNP